MFQKWRLVPRLDNIQPWYCILCFIRWYIYVCTALLNAVNYDSVVYGAIKGYCSETRLNKIMITLNPNSQFCVVANGIPNHIALHIFSWICWFVGDIHHIHVVYIWQYLKRYIYIYIHISFQILCNMDGVNMIYVSCQRIL